MHPLPVVLAGLHRGRVLSAFPGLVLGSFVTLARHGKLVGPAMTGEVKSGVHVPAVDKRANRAGREHRAAVLLRTSMKLRGGRIPSRDGMNVLVDCGLPVVAGRRDGEPTRVDGRTVRRVLALAGAQSVRQGFGPGSRCWWVLS